MQNTQNGITPTCDAVQMLFVSANVCAVKTGVAAWICLLHEQSTSQFPQCSQPITVWSYLQSGIQGDAEDGDLTGAYGSVHPQ